MLTCGGCLRTDYWAYICDLILLDERLLHIWLKYLSFCDSLGVKSFPSVRCNVKPRKTFRKKNGH